MKEFIKKVAEIQRTIKAPKNQIVKNRSGGELYRFRNAEDILTGYKEVQGETLITINVYPYKFEGVTWFKAIATITDGEHSLSAESNAEHPKNRGNMEPAQSSGATESYVKKYALCNLLAIDDSKIEHSPDPDSQICHDSRQESNYVQKSPGQRKTIPPSEKQINFLKTLIKEKHGEISQEMEDKIKTLDIKSCSEQIERLKTELGK